MVVAGDTDPRRVEVSVLGPVTARVGGVEVVPHGVKERTLLGLLVTHADHVVSVDALVDALWGDAPPRSAEKSLQIYVARLRRTLEPDQPRGGPFRVLTTEGSGYRLRIDPDAVDAGRFVERVGAGRARLAAGDAGGAVDTLHDALSLWRGRPYDDVAEADFVALERTRLGEQRAAAFEDFTSAQLELGRSSELVPALEAAVDAEPFRERLWMNLMLALYRAGRQADALRTFQRARSMLVEELGVEPGPELRDLEAAILDHDRNLLVEPRPGAVSTPAGRDDVDLEWLESLWDDLSTGRRRIVSTRRLRVLVGSIAAALVAVVVVGLIAVDRSSDADRSESQASRSDTVADASRLAARARGSVPGDTDLSLLLAVQARRLHRSPSTDGALEAALAATPPGLEHSVAVGPDAGLAAVTHDGRRVAVPLANGGVELVELRTGQRTTRPPTRASSPGVAASFSADDRRLAVAGEDGRVRILDASGRPALPPIEAGPGPALAVFDPTDSDVLFTTAGDGSVSAWDLSAGRADRRSLGVVPRTGNDALPTSLSVSADGSRLLVGEVEQGPSRVLDVANGSVVAEVDGAPGAIDAPGTQVATARGSTVDVVDLADGVTRSFPGLERPVASMDFDAAGDTLAVGDAVDSSVHVFDLTTGTEVGAPITMHRTTVAPLFLEDGRLFTRSAERVALLGARDSAVAAPGRVVGRSTGPVIAQAAIGRPRVATITSGGDGRVWTLGGQPVETTAGVGRRVVLYDSELRRQLTTDGAGDVEVADLDGAPIVSLGTPGLFVHGWSPDGELLVGGSADGIELRRVTDGGTERVAILQAHGATTPAAGQVGYLTTAWFSPDGRRVAILREQDGVATVYRTSDGRQEYAIELPGTQRLRALAFDTAGEQLAVAGGNERTGSGVIEVHDARTGRVQESFPLEYDPNGVAFVNGDRWFAALDVARFSRPDDPGASSIHLLDRATAQEIGQPLGFPAGASFGAAADGGRAFVVGSDRGFATVWDVDPDAWEATACQLAGRTLTRAEWERHLPGRRYDPACR